MHEIIAQKNIQAPLATIWALVEDFSNLDWYSPATIESTVIITVFITIYLARQWQIIRCVCP